MEIVPVVLQLDLVALTAEETHVGRRHELVARHEYTRARAAAERSRYFLVLKIETNLD